MKKGTKIKQHDITDCGAACLASVCAHYGLRFPVSRIRQYAFTDQKGTNVLGLIEAANKLGLSAKGVRAQFDALYTIPKPTIAHVLVNHKQLQHFIVIYKVTKTHITYMDPGDGRMHKVLHEDFRHDWTGILVLMEPEETFKKGNQQTSMSKKFLSLLAPHKSVMLQAVFGAMKSILALKTGQRIDAALILGYYKHLLTLPQQFFDTMCVSEIISRVNDAVKTQCRNLSKVRLRTLAQSQQCIRRQQYTKLLLLRKHRNASFHRFPAECIRITQQVRPDGSRS